MTQALMAHQGNARRILSQKRAGRLQRLGMIAGIILSLGLIGLVADGYATRYFFQEATQRGENTLRLTSVSLRGQLARFERLPRLIAQQTVIQTLLDTPDDPVRREAANVYLRDTNVLLGASDIYVLDLSGLTVAASNYDTDISFVGGNFSFRPYFLDALRSGDGRFYAIGTTSLKRGYYFGAPITEAGRITGVLVIKIDLDDIETSWGGGDFEVVVTDPEGIIFLASRPDWWFQSIQPLTPERLARTEATQRYANARLSELGQTETQIGQQFRLMTIGEAGQDKREYLVIEEEMAEADWTVKVLLHTASARAQAHTTVASGILLAALAILSAAMIRQRRLRLAERLEMQRAAQGELEARVRDRTAELAALNATLETEVGERRNTEAALRQTQAELIQAGKLAALGQMSAALSHEFNQPLAATRNYAENALLLLDRDRGTEARSNIGQIVSLVDRMSRISSHLRSFARKPNQKLSPVPLADVLTATLDIMAWRLDNAGVTLETDLPEDIHVIAGPVRLQQVLVNILSNAVDAVETAADKRLHLTARTDGKMTRITLRDHGTGIAPGLQDRIFDPFFSTKGVGKGLGLGLSISYNIVRDFGGKLEAANHAGGGAVFTLTLRAASAHRQAAE